ncbi:hypothetical protein BDY24DRAFT_25412 [Mrakia frigida]|uniref:uncharacterized protein n=1 Tax=Mrakia frigida TaxID=29902 RepID=UPI003FCBF340
MASLPVLPRTSNPDPSSLAYPSASYPDAEEAEAESPSYAQDDHHDEDQDQEEQQQEEPYEGYPEDASSSTHQDQAYSGYPYDSNGDVTTQGSESEAGPSTWVAAEVHDYAESTDPESSQQQHFDSAVEGQYALSQDAAAAISDNYYLGYHSGEAGGGEYSGGVDGAEGGGGGGGGRTGNDELDPAGHLNGEGLGDGSPGEKGKKRGPDGSLKKEGGRRNTPKEVKLGPDGKPKIELACHPCRQRKIR